MESVIDFEPVLQLKPTPGSISGSYETFKDDTAWKVKILVVEDNQINRELLEEILGKVGVVVDTASSGQEALQSVENASYDVVLMDIGLAGMDGYEVTDHIRKDIRFEKLPVIAMTGHADESDREKSKQAGMQAHLVKPVDTNLLFSALKSCVKRWEHRINSPAPNNLPSPVETNEDAPSVDLKLALQRLRISKSLYLDLLNKFAASGNDKLTGIEAALADRKPENAILLAHSLKGLASNLAAMPLSKAAALLEKALRQNEHSDLKILVSKVQKNFSAVLTSIKELTDKNASPPEKTSAIKVKSIDKTASILNKLADLLIENDIEAESHIRAVSDCLQGCGLAEISHKIVEQISSYDFSGALETLYIIGKKLEIKIKGNT